MYLLLWKNVRSDAKLDPTVGVKMEWLEKRGAERGVGEIDEGVRWSNGMRMILEEKNLA